MQRQAVFRHIRRFPYQSLAAIVMTVATFFIVSVFSLVVMGSQTLLVYFESRPQVTAFFRDNTPISSVDSLKAQITARIPIESTHYISQNDALAIYREQNADNPLLLEMVTADILPASLEVSAKNVTDLESVASLMQKDSAVEEVVFQKDIIDTLKKWVGGIRATGIALSSLLIILSLITIVIILGLKFTTQKTEIKTLSLLGATPWYIRGPFVVEGMLYGALGALLGWGIAYITLLYLTPNLVNFLSGIPLLPVNLFTMLIVLGGETLLGLLIGGLASVIATRRYGR